MRYEKFPPKRNWRFHDLARSGMIARHGTAIEMPLETATNQAAEVARKRPRVRDYFLRPWYARLWWAAACAFWLLVAADAFAVHFLPRPDETWHLWVVMLLHPYVIVPVLGFRYARDWLEYSGFYDNEESEPAEGLYDGDNGVGFHSKIDNPMDPLDPRFNMLPGNPGSPAWRERHVWGGD